MTSPAAYVRVELPWPDKRLSPNARPNRYELGRVKSGARATGRIMTKAAKPPRFMPDAPLCVTTTFYPPDSRPRDEDNLKASMKAAYDGIADAIGVDDKHFRHQPIRIGEPIKGGMVVVELEAIDTWEHVSEPASRVIASIPNPKRGAA